MTHADPKARLAELRRKLPKPTPEKAAAMEERAATAQPQLLTLVEQIASRDDDPYTLGRELYRTAIQYYGPTGRNCAKAATLYWVWLDFDDLAGEPTWRGHDLEEAMFVAADEWLRIQDTDEEEWRAYQDRWHQWAMSFGAKRRAQ